VVIPPWQSPDETGHFEYVWTLARLRRIPRREDASPFLERELLASLYEWRYGVFIDRPLPARMPARLADLPTRVHAQRARTLLAGRFSLAYLWLDTGTGALLLFGAVQMTMIGAGLRAGERPTSLRTLGILTAFVGVIVLVAPGVTAPEPAGALLMAAAGVAWGVYSLLGRGVPAPVGATARNFLLAALVAALVPLLAPGSLRLSSEGTALAVISGAVTSGLGYVIWYAALRGHSATSAAVVQLVVPVLAAAGGVLFLGETPTPRLFAAGALTLGGVLLAVLSRRATRTPVR